MSSPHAMFQHPVIAIQSGIQQFSLKSKPICQKLLPGEFETIKQKVETAVEKFTNFNNATISQFKLNNDEDVKKYQSDGKREIFLSALAPDFIDKYSSDLHYEDTYEKLKSFVSDLIGSQTDSAKRKAAEEKMANLSRDSTTEEKFTRFLTRLERLAKIVTDKEDVQKFLLAKHFRRSLSPKMKTFLQEQNQLSAEPEIIAKFLDKMGKNKQTMDLFSLESSETRTEIQALIQAALNDKFDRLQADMREILNHQRANAFDYQAVEVNAMTKRTQQKPEPNATLIPRKPTRPRQTNTYPGQWTRPITCQKCGFRGHSAENCRGHRLTCHLCNQVGHIKPVCPQKQLINSSKN